MWCGVCVCGKTDYTATLKVFRVRVLSVAIIRIANQMCPHCGKFFWRKFLIATLKNTNSKHFKCSCIITFSTPHTHHTPHTHPCPVTNEALYTALSKFLDIKHNFYTFL